MDGTDAYKSCGKWEIRIERDQRQGEKDERPELNSQGM